MNCKVFSQFLENYPDFDPEMEEKSAFLSHLKECPQCRKTFEIHMEIVAKLKKSGQVSPSPNLGKAVMSEILKPSQPDSDSLAKGPGFPIAAGVSIAILLGGVFLALKSLPSPQPTELRVSTPSPASRSADPIIGSVTPNVATSAILASQGTSLDKNPD